MNKCKFLICLILPVLFCGCQKERYPINGLADLSWYLSSDKDNKTPIIVGLNKDLSLMDISQGTTSHLWDVKGDGVYFLKGTLGAGEIDFDSMIDRPAPDVTTEKIIHLYFTKPGLKTVRLRNSFDKQVSYTFTEGLEPNLVKRTVYAKEENGEFVMDTTFVVDVYDTLMIPKAKIFKDEEMTQEVEYGVNEDGSFKRIELEFGENLYFKDESYDRPNSWKWVCEQSGDIVKGEKTAMCFKKLADASHPLNIRLTVAREHDGMRPYIPIAAAKDSLLPLDIVVKPSSQPIEYSIRQKGNNSLELVLGNAEFNEKAVTALTGDEFSIVWKNDYNGASLLEGKSSVSGLHLDKDKSILVLELAEPIYNTDRIYVSTESLEQVTTDMRTLQIQVPAEPNVKTSYLCLFKEDFEDDSAKEDWYMCNADRPAEPNVCKFLFGAQNPMQEGINKSSRVFFADPSTNDQPGKIVKDALRGVRFNANKASYKIRFKYMITAPGKAGLTTFIVPADKPNTANEEWAKPAFWVPLAPATPNVWLEAERNIEGKKDFEGLSLALRFNIFSGKIYLDDFFFGYDEIRPRN